MFKAFVIILLLVIAYNVLAVDFNVVALHIPATSISAEHNYLYVNFNGDREVYSIPFTVSNWSL